MDNSLEKKNSFAPRIGDSLSSESYQVIKIGERLLFRPSDGKLDPETGGIMHRDLVYTINKYKRHYEESKAPVGFTQSYVDRYHFLLSMCKPDELDRALAFFKKAKEQYIFVEQKENLRIVDFLKQYRRSSWSQYLLLIRNIPTEYIGQAKYSFDVSGETLEFRSEAIRDIWSISAKPVGHARLFSTTNGTDKAPLLIQISHPMDPDLDNGCYLVIPK